MKHYIVTDEYVGARADTFVSSQYPEYSRSAVSKLFDAGVVTMHEAALKTGYKLRAGDVVDVDDHLLVDEPPMIDIPIIYEDDTCIVIYKPVGILAHSKGAFNPEATVASWLAHRGAVAAFDDEVGETGNNRAGIVHRLDRTTSGVMICAKTPEASAWLQKQFSSRNVKKTYIAIIGGHLKDAEAIIDMPIERNPAIPKSFHTTKTGKPSITHYRVISETEKHSLVELKPVTGRTHQLRVHLKAIGHPIVGDTLYGGEPAIRVYLHAISLEITLPNSQRKTFTAALPPEFTQGIA